MKSRYKILLAIILGPSVACQVQRKATPPSAYTQRDLPPTYSHALRNEPSNKPVLSEVAWRVFFTDPGLQKCISCAIENNLDLALAVKNLEIADKYREQNSLDYLPDVNILADGSLSLTKASKETTQASVALQVAWEVDLWQKLKNSRRIFLARYLQTHQAQRAMQLAIISQVAEHYYDLHSLTEKAKLLAHYQRLAEQTTTLMELQYQAGNATVLAVQQNIAQKLSIQAMIPEVQQSIELHKQALYTLMGEMTPEEIKIPAKLLSPRTDKYLVGFPADLLSLRPDVQIAESKLREASANANLKLKDMYPSFRINATTGWQYIMNSKWYAVPDALFAVASGAFVEPLFNRKKLKIGYKVALLERDKAVISFKKAVVEAIAEVNDVLVQLSKARELQVLVDKKFEVLQQAHKNSLALFNSGLANYLEVIAAENALLDAALERLACLERCSKLSIALYKAVGGGKI